MGRRVATEAEVIELWEYKVLLDSGAGYVNPFTDIEWTTLGHIQRYLASWRGNPDWAHLKVRVLRRRRAGKAHEVPADLYLSEVR